MIDKELEEIIVCPKCKSSIRVDDSNNAIICDQCRLSYPITDDIPILLIDHAKAI